MRKLFTTRNFSVFVIIVIAASLVLSLLLLSQRQDLRKEAAEYKGMTHVPTTNPTYPFDATNPLPTETPTTEEEITVLNTRIKKLINTTNFTMTNELQTLLQERKNRMYYLAKNNPDLFIKNVLSSDDSQYLPVQLIESVDMVYQGIISVDNTSKSYYVTSQQLGYRVNLYFVDAQGLSLEDGSMVAATGVQIGDRLVISRTGFSGIKKIDKLMEGH